MLELNSAPARRADGKPAFFAPGHLALRHPAGTQRPGSRDPAANGVDGVIGIGYRRRGYPRIRADARDGHRRPRRDHPRRQRPQPARPRLAARSSSRAANDQRRVRMRVPGRSCRCDAMPVRWPISNPSGLRRIAYRSATSPRSATRCCGISPARPNWTSGSPTAGSDLGLQVLDWWAYIADILTFYNERIANEDYLGTASPRYQRPPPGRPARLPAAAGHRRRPRTLAVIASGPGPLHHARRTRHRIEGRARAWSPRPSRRSHRRHLRPSRPACPAPAPDDLADAPPAAGPPSTAAPGVAEPPAHSQLIARGGVLVKGTRHLDRRRRPAAADRQIMAAAGRPRRGRHGARSGSPRRTRTAARTPGSCSPGPASLGAAPHSRLPARPRHPRCASEHPAGERACRHGQPDSCWTARRVTFKPGDPLLLERPGPVPVPGRAPAAGSPSSR